MEDQATDRSHRIGHHEMVHVHHLIAEYTVEDQIGEPGIPSVFNEFWLADGQRISAGRLAGGAALVAGGLPPGWSS